MTWQSYEGSKKPKLVLKCIKLETIARICAAAQNVLHKVEKFSQVIWAVGQKWSGMVPTRP